MANNVYIRDRDNNQKVDGSEVLLAATAEQLLSGFSRLEGYNPPVVQQFIDSAVGHHARKPRQSTEDYVKEAIAGMLTTIRAEPDAFTGVTGDAFREIAQTFSKSVGASSVNLSKEEAAAILELSGVEPGSRPLPVGRKGGMGAQDI